jgi:glycerol-3-phosphate acyltransferase PlsY
LSLITFAVFVGHIFPVFFGFNGGKGVATACGCLLALAWPVGASALATWILMVLLFRYSSLAAVVAALCAPVYAWYFTNMDYTYMTEAMMVLLLLRHRKNIRNLLAGKEDKVGKKSKTVAAV